MPIALTATLNGNEFKVEGIEAFTAPATDPIISLFRTWVNAQGGEGAVQIETLAEQVRDVREDLTGFVEQLKTGLG